MAAIKINELYEEARGIINPFQSGFFDDMFTGYANTSSRDYFDYLITILKEFQDTTLQQAASEPESMLKVTDLLHPFIKRVVLKVDGEGRMIRPDDYAYYADMRLRHDQGELYQCLCNGENKLDCAEFPNDPTGLSNAEKIKEILTKPFPAYRVEILDLKQYTDRTASHIYKPARRFPVCYPFTEEGTTNDNNVLYWQLDPVNIGSAVLLYYKQPRDAVYATTTDAFGDNVYDSANSKNLEWDKKLQSKLAQKVATLYSQFINKKELYDTSTDQTKQPV